MKSTKFFLILFAAIFTLSACDNRTSHRRTRHAVKHEKVVHLKDGRYAYKDNNIWYIYMYMNMQNQRIQSYQTTSLAPSLPSGGSWVQAGDIADFASDAVEAFADVSVQVSPAGEPITVTEAATESSQSLADYNSSEGYDHGQAMSDGDHSDTSSMDTSSSADTSSSFDTSSSADTSSSSSSSGDPQ